MKFLKISNLQQLQRGAPQFKEVDDQNYQIYSLSCNLFLSITQNTNFFRDSSQFFSLENKSIVNGKLHVMSIVFLELNNDFIQLDIQVFQNIMINSQTYTRDKQRDYANISIEYMQKNKVYNATVNLNEKVMMLNNEFKQILRDEGRSKFRYNQQPLDLNKTFKEYGIYHGSVLTLSIEMQGGATINSFCFSNMKNKQKLQFASDAPRWRQVNIGLNLIGNCEFKECEAFQQKIICKIGLGKFNMAEQICKLKCPMCGKKGKANGACLFWYCEYDIIGLEMDKEEEFEVLNQIAPINHATQFNGEDETSKSEWQYLNIETRKLQRI